MNSKGITITVVIGIVALALGLIASSFQGGAQYSPTDDDPSDQPFINANECTRDGVCEVNAISTRDPFRHINVDANLTVTDGIQTTAISTRNLGVFDQFGTTFIAGGGSIYGVAADIIFRGRVSASNSLTVGENLRVISLSTPIGNATAYVCVTGSGSLYRSTAPCV